MFNYYFRRLIFCNFAPFLKKLVECAESNFLGQKSYINARLRLKSYTPPIFIFLGSIVWAVQQPQRMASFIVGLIKSFLAHKLWHLKIIKNILVNTMNYVMNNNYKQAEMKDYIRKNRLIQFRRIYHKNCTHGAQLEKF